MDITTNRLRLQEDICKWLYYFLNLLCLYLIAARALSMPIQGDEAGTYLRHATAGFEGLFNLGTANNHFLNTFLITLATAKASFSEAAIRIPVVLTYAWFFLFYVPSRFCFSRWSDRLLFASLSLLPYYINEYASMARGYIMSACFACAALNELALFSNSSPQSANGFIDRHLHLRFVASEQLRMVRVCLFSSLAALSSILMFPFFVIVNVYGLVHLRRLTCLTYCRRELPRLTAAIVLAGGAFVLSVHTFMAIKNSGVSTIASPPIGFGAWLIKLPQLLWIPIVNVAHAPGSSSQLFAQMTCLASAISVLAAIFYEGSRQHLRAAIVLVASTLFLIYSLALIGSYPTGRGWLPFWFIIVFVIVAAINLNFDPVAIKYFPAQYGRWLAVSGLTALTLIAVWSVWRSYQGNYVYELRPFYYQYKSLMHYSREQDLKCLSHGDINDEVLKFYFLNDAGPVPLPKECPVGVKSQPGFMPYSYANKEPVFD
jgi:hypothetical protein